jgi:hypothetical protein
VKRLVGLPKNRQRPLSGFLFPARAGFGFVELFGVSGVHRRSDEPSRSLQSGPCLSNNLTNLGWPGPSSHFNSRTFTSLSSCTTWRNTSSLSSRINLSSWSLNTFVQVPVLKYSCARPPIVCRSVSWVCPMVTYLTSSFCRICSTRVASRLEPVGSCRPNRDFSYSPISPRKMISASERTASSALSAQGECRTSACQWCQPTDRIGVGRIGSRM